MGERTRADLDRMRGLADRIDEVATAMADHRPAGYPARDLVVADTAFGNTYGASACHGAWSAVRDAAEDAYANLLATLESDVVRLGQVIDVFRRMDDESADEICAAQRGLNIFTTHVHSPDRGRRGANDDERAGQINTAMEHAASSVGPTVFTGDLNEVRTADTRSAGAIDDIVDDYGYTDAGIASGPTSSDGTGGRIDYIFASPDITPAGPGVNVDGGPSDHNGVAVTINVPRDW